MNSVYPTEDLHGSLEINTWKLLLQIKESLLPFYKMTLNCSTADSGRRAGKKHFWYKRGTRMDCLATKTMEFPLLKIFKKEPDKHLSGST